MSFCKNGTDLFNKTINTIYSFQLRYAAKSPAQSQGGYKKKPKKYGLNKNPGDRVDERQMIGTQKHLNFFPGYNVGINPRDKSLYAIYAGTVYYSFEKVNLNPRHPLVEQFFTNNDETHPYYNKYVHVVPDKPENEFRLVDIV